SGLALSLGAVAAGARDGEAWRRQAATIPPALPPGRSRAATAWDTSSNSPGGERHVFYPEPLPRPPPPPDPPPPPAPGGAGVPPVRRRGPAHRPRGRVSHRPLVTAGRHRLEVAPCLPFTGGTGPVGQRPASHRPGAPAVTTNLKGEDHEALSEPSG